MANAIYILSILSVVGGIWLWAYLKGRRDSKRDALASSAEALADSLIKQEKRERDFIKRVEEINTTDITPEFASDLLRSWPDDGKPTSKTGIKSGKNKELQ